MRDRVEHGGGDAQHANELLVEDADPARGDGAERELFLTRRSELADDEDVERRAETASDLVRDGHAAARQGQHHHVGASRVMRDALGEGATGLVAIGKHHRHLHESGSPGASRVPWSSESDPL
jgi:hypothetical protein